MKLKSTLPDGHWSVPARYKNSSAPTNVEVNVVDGHVTVDAVIGQALLDHDKDKNLDRFEYVSDEVLNEEVRSFHTVASVEPVTSETSEATEPVEATEPSEPSEASEGDKAGGKPKRNK